MKYEISAIETVEITNRVWWEIDAESPEEAKRLLRESYEVCYEANGVLTDSRVISRGFKISSINSVTEVTNGDV